MVLIDQRFAAKEIAFKASKNRGNFLRSDELKEKTIAAVMHVMFKKNIMKPFALLFNEMHNIGKIIFMPKHSKKIDLTKHSI